MKPKDHDRLLDEMEEILRLIAAKDEPGARHVAANLSDIDRKRLAVVWRLTAKDMAAGLALVRSALSLMEVNDG